MDFMLDDTQGSLRELARQIFVDRATHDRLKELEAGGQSFDADLWDTLGSAGLLSVGTDLGGFLEQCVLFVEQGRAVAPVPLWSHLVPSAMVVPAREGILTVALDEPGADSAYAATTTAEEAGSAWFLSGDKVGVPALDLSDWIVVSASTPDGPALFVVRNDEEVISERRETTARFPEFAVRFNRHRADRLEAHSATLLAQRCVVALCAIGVGVAERALELTASYTSERKQFDQPLGKFQAVQQRAADAYVDVEAMRVTMWQAAWRLSEGLDATHAVDVAKFWAAEGGQRVVSAAQHLHGGMGADIDYPLHRYTLWSKWVELSFGGAAPTLARIGEAIAR